MSNPKIQIGHNRFGRCLIAAADISKGEVVAEFDGPEYSADKCSDLEKDIADHAIQFEENAWKDSVSVARLINHSCEPNCGLRDLFTIVTMRDVQEGEELLWDYDMSEDSDWRMECQCGNASCRKEIGSFAALPMEIRNKYRGYISDWLVEKYGLEK